VISLRYIITMKVRDLLASGGDDDILSVRGGGSEERSTCELSGVGALGRRTRSVCIYGHE